MYIRFCMIRNHVNSNIDRLYIIYIRFSIVPCHIISNIVLSRISHIRYYIASDHGNSNIYRRTHHIYSIVDEQLTIECRICEKQENPIFDIRW